MIISKLGRTTNINLANYGISTLTFVIIHEDFPVPAIKYIKLSSLAVSFFFLFLFLLSIPLPPQFIFISSLFTYSFHLPFFYFNSTYYEVFHCYCCYLPGWLCGCRLSQVSHSSSSRSAIAGSSNEFSELHVLTYTGFLYRRFPQMTTSLV